jgi:protein disulfide-isomerase A1
MYLDPQENPGAMDFFGVKSEDTPLLAVHSPAENAKYASGKLSVDKIEGWVAEFKAGKIEKTIKSEAVPESNDGPVKVVVAKQFQEIVLSGKNVFVEFYAPWCGHCKRLEPVWTELGEKYKDRADLVIAKMDATANDVPDDRFDVKGFPTLYFVDSKGEIKKYGGGRSIEDLTKYVSDALGIEVPAAGAGESGEKKDEL